MNAEQSIVLNSEPLSVAPNKRVVIQNIITSNSKNNVLGLPVTIMSRSSTTNVKDTVTLADSTIKSNLSDVHVIKGLPQLVLGSKKPLTDDITNVPNKKLKTIVMAVKEEPVEFKLPPSDEDDDFNDVSIEVTNSDFLDAFDNRMETASMYPKVTDDLLNYVECSVCFKKIKESSLKQHFKTHSGERPHPCDICGTRFTRKGDVYRHKRVVHRKLKPYVCKKCDRTFPDRNLLVVHLKNHDKCVYYECETCGYKFGKKEYYENHTRYIHPLADGATPIVSKDEDIIEAQLKELEEEDDLTPVSSDHYNSSTLKNQDQSDGSITLAPSEEEQIIEDVDETSNDEESSDSCITQSNDSCNNTDKQGRDPSVLSVQLQTVSKINGKDEDLVNKILDAAVTQATSTLEQLGSAQQKQRILQSKKWPKNANKQKAMDIVIRAVVDGQIRRFVIQIQTVKGYDLQSQVGMELILSMVNQLCQGKGSVEGPIDVEMIQNNKD
uniref:Zinc finger protein Aiolos-like n=2 Tax=Hirondellea gigas TaxID=1518452 RepID=A0A6A7FVG3_9CRUS